MLYDNPAARLKAILERGKSIQRENSCRQVWEEILEAESGNSGDLFARLGTVMALPRRTAFLVKTHFPHQDESTSLWMSSLEAAFINQNLSGQWATFIDHINPHCIPYIGLIADLLQGKVSTQVIKDEDITKIIDSVKALMNDVDKSMLSVQLKNYLSQELFDLLQAVREYRVSGAVPILKQAEAMVGHTLLDREYYDFLTSHELGKRLLDNLNAMAAVLTVAVSLPVVTQGFIAMLPK